MTLTRIVCVSLVLAPFAHPQEPCPNRGSQRVLTHWSSGPTLACSTQGEPGWWLRTPSHRRVVPKVGATLGQAHAFPQLILRYRCTGLAIQPIALYEVRTWGVALDVEEHSCSGPLPLPSPPATDR